MINELKIKKNIDKLYENFINEEMGIANAIKDVCWETIQNINNGIKTSSSIPINYEGITFKKGNYSFELMNKTVSITWYYFNFFYKESYDRYINNIARQFRNVSNGLHIQLVIIHISGQPINGDEFEDTLFHEVEHVYQYINNGCQYFNYDKNIYQKASTEWIFSKNPLIKAIGEVIYISNRFEQDAKMNALYSALMRTNNKEDMWKTLKENDTYLWYETAKKSMNFFINQKEDMNLRKYIKKMTGLDYKKISDMLKKTTKRMENKIGKIYSKALKDKNNYCFEHINLKKTVNDTPIDYNLIMKNMFRDKILNTLINF